MPDEPRLDDPSRHWDAAYTARGTDGVSWFQDVPTVSLQLIEAMGIPPDAAVIDVGGGASGLVGRLVELGFSDLTVLDVSESALEEIRRRLGDSLVIRLREDLLEWQPDRRYDLGHDRALFHA